MGKYELKDKEWKGKLENHLLRSELEFVAANGGDNVEFLKPYLKNRDDLKKFLNRLGFRIKEFYDCDGEWVRLINGICIDLETGFCLK